jgi:hypothetical protein
MKEAWGMLLWFIGLVLMVFFLFALAAVMCPVLVWLTQTVENWLGV